MAIIYGSLFDILYNNYMLRLLIRIASMRFDEFDQAILMSTHNIQFHDKIKFP